MKKLFIGVFLASFLSACAQVGTDKLSMDVVGNIQEGVTTESDVRDMLGKPYTTARTDGKLTLTYMKGSYKFGKSEGMSLVVSFDEEGKVDSVTTAEINY